jgi:hypothetical protein
MLMIMVLLVVLVVRCWRSQGQFNPEAAALPREAAGLDVPVMGCANGFDDRKAQARAALFA